MANGGEGFARTTRVQAKLLRHIERACADAGMILRELQRLVGAASAHLGVVVSSNERHAYWIDGRT